MKPDDTLPEPLRTRTREAWNFWNERFHDHILFGGKAVTRPTHDDYLNLIQGRLRQGAKEYGARSFDKQLSKIVEEMIEEIADVAGWGYILYCKLINLRGVMVALESPDPKATLGDYLTPEPTEWRISGSPTFEQLDLFKDTRIAELEQRARDLVEERKASERCVVQLKAVIESLERRVLHGAKSQP